MKRNIMIALVLSIMVTSCANAWDFSSLTLEELYVLQDELKDEIAKREAGEDLSTYATVYMQDGINIYMSKDIKVEDSKLLLTFAFSNKTEQGLYFIPYNGLIGVNDWAIYYDLFCSVPPGYKRTESVEIILSNTNVKEYDDIETITVPFTILDQSQETLIECASKTFTLVH